MSLRLLKAYSEYTYVDKIILFFVLLAFIFIVASILCITSPQFHFNNLSPKIFGYVVAFCIVESIFVIAIFESIEKKLFEKIANLIFAIFRIIGCVFSYGNRAEINFSLFEQYLREESQSMPNSERRTVEWRSVPLLGSLDSAQTGNVTLTGWTDTTVYRNTSRDIFTNMDVEQDNLEQNDYSITIATPFGSMTIPKFLEWARTWDMHEKYGIVALEPIDFEDIDCSECIDCIKSIINNQESAGV